MNMLQIVILLLLSCIAGLFEEQLKCKSRMVLYVLLSIVFSIVFANRSILTPDTGEYIHIFDQIDMSDGLFSQFDRYEIGYLAFNRLAKSISQDYRFVFFSVSVICFLLQMIAYRLSISSVLFGVEDHRPLLFFLVYIPYFGLLYNGTAMRACAALALIYLAKAYASKRKYIAMGLLSIFAVFFHQTIVLAIPIVLIEIMNISIRKKSATRWVLVLFILYILGIGSLTANTLLSITNKLYQRFPGNSLFFWAFHYLSEGVIRENAISISRLFYFVLVYLTIMNTGSGDRISKYSFNSLIGLSLLVLFGNYSIVIRLAEIYLLSICFGIATMNQYSINGRNRIKLMKTVSITIPLPVFAILVAGLYFVIYLRNVAIT